MAVVREWLARAVLVGCGLLVACGGPDAAQVPVLGTLSYTGFSSEPQSVSLVLPSSAGISVSSAWLMLGDVHFVAADDCEPAFEDPLAAYALGAVDHGRGSVASTPLELPQGRYCGLRLPLLRVSDDRDEAPARMAGHSIAIEGSLPDGRSFEIRSALEEELLLLARVGSFEMSDELSTVVIGFDLATWLEGMDLSSVPSAESGSVVVDEDSPAGLLERFEYNVRRGTALYRDPAGTGHVSRSSQSLASGQR